MSPSGPFGRSTESRTDAGRAGNRNRPLTWDAVSLSEQRDPSSCVHSRRPLQATSRLPRLRRQRRRRRWRNGPRPAWSDARYRRLRPRAAVKHVSPCSLFLVASAAAVMLVPESSGSPAVFRTQECGNSRRRRREKDPSFSYRFLSPAFPFNSGIRGRRGGHRQLSLVQRR